MLQQDDQQLLNHVEPAILDVLVGFWWFPCSFCCMFLSLGMPWLGPLSSKGSTSQRCCLQWRHSWCPCLYVCQKVLARFWKSFSNCRVVIGASLPVHPELVYGVWKGSEFRFNNLTLVSHTQLARDSLSADIGRAQVWRLSPAGRQKYSSALPWCKEQKKTQCVSMVMNW